MRKDKIEERISKVEKDVRTLKINHKEGVDDILAEMRTFQNLIIEEKIDTIRQQLVQQYEKVIIDLLIKNASNVLNEKFHDPCVKDRRKNCHEFFVSKLEDIAKTHDYSTQIVSTDSEDESDKELVELYPIFRNPPCKECFDTYLNEKKKLKDNINRLDKYKKSILEKKGDVFISELPEDIVISSIVDPLSHEMRFAMLKALSTGSMTFKELGLLTNSKGGHLLYHLNKLIDSRLVVKDDSSKRYSISDKGMGVMDLIKKLYTQ